MAHKNHNNIEEIKHDIRNRVAFPQVRAYYHSQTQTYVFVGVNVKANRYLVTVKLKTRDMGTLVYHVLAAEWHDGEATWFTRDGFSPVNYTLNRNFVACAALKPIPEDVLEIAVPVDIAMLANIFDHGFAQALAMRGTR